METDTKTQEATVPTYIKQDSELGFVQGEHDVKQMKAMRVRDVISNDLLGDFDESGKYILSDAVAADLVAITKKIDSNDTNGTQGRAFVGDRVLHFNLTPPVALDKDTAYCYLQLLEEIPRINGYYIDTLTTVVATYEYKNDEYFFERALQVFNFKEYKVDETVEPQIVPDSFAERYAFIAAMRKQAYEPMDTLEEAYFNKRLQLLSEDPELAIILAEFANKRNKLEPFFDKAEHKYAFLNQILDEVLEMPACKKALENSPVREQLVEADIKAYDLTVKVEEKVRTDNRTKVAVEQAIFTDVGAEQAPKPKLPPQVSKGAKFEAGLFGQGVSTKKWDNPEKGGKGGGGKKDKPKQEEKKGPILFDTTPPPAPKPPQQPQQQQQQGGSPFGSKMIDNDKGGLSQEQGMVR